MHDKVLKCIPSLSRSNVFGATTTEMQLMFYGLSMKIWLGNLLRKCVNKLIIAGKLFLVTYK